jgi:hypothetical protein
MEPSLLQSSSLVALSPRGGRIQTLFRYTQTGGALSVVLVAILVCLCVASWIRPTPPTEKGLGIHSEFRGSEQAKRACHLWVLKRVGFVVVVDSPRDNKA